jgi:EmrB/QacA subfamily drug resistance transporter
MTDDHLDPRRWVTLGIIIMSLVIVVLDTTVLNVSIPTILRELHTELPTLQWVLTGYSLTFATCLIIGGRLGDVYGARRMFIIGAALFGLGSFLASEAQSVTTLIVGEAIIEGVGASLMMPATLAILSNTFDGHERATAFSIWGAASGVAVAFGPVLGGFLTTNYSWRWAFRINVIVAPLAILGAVLFMRRPPPVERRPRIDIPGALLIGSGTFCLVFALSQGAIYGWIRPLQDFTIGSVDVWPASLPVSMIAPIVGLAAVLLGSFVVLERHKERHESDPLFEFSQLRHLTFRYGLITTAVLAMGQLGFLFVLPVLLQDGARHLSAIETGVWLVPSGVCIAVGAQIGGRLTRIVNTTIVVRIGLAAEAVGLVLMALAVSSSITFMELLPGLVVFSLGLGFASSQLTNVVLSKIEKRHAGAASGANTTVRQIGAALGIAVIGSILSTQTVRHAAVAIRSSALDGGAKSRALDQLHASGVGFVPPQSLTTAIENAVASGARPALFFAAFVVSAGALLSLLIPHVDIVPTPTPSTESFEPVEVAEALDAATAGSMAGS